MRPAPQHKTWKENKRIQLLIVLILISMGYSISLQKYCTSNHLAIKSSGPTARQWAKLREHVGDTLNRDYPHQITGFAPTAYGRYTVCLEVYIGPDRQLDNTPGMIVKTSHNEIWSMWYFLGYWHKLGETRVDR